MYRILFVSVVVGLLTNPALAQQPRTYTFLGLQRGDTLGSEVVKRGPTWVEVDMFVAPQGVRQWFAMTVAPDGTVRSIQNLFYREAPSEQWSQRVRAEFDQEARTATVRLDNGEGERTVERPAPAGAIPWIFPSNALIEQVLIRSRSMPGQPDTVPLFILQNGQTAEAVVRWTDAETAEITMADTRLRASMGPDGSLREVHVGPRRIVRVEGSHPLPMGDPVSYDAPADAPYTAEEVTVETAIGLSLGGTLTLPKDRNGRVPAVVTITGSGPQDRDEKVVGVAGYRPFREIADTLGRRGIAVLRLDDRGVNASDAGPPDATSADYALDVRAALDFLRARPEIDPDEIALLGHSEGGMIAPMVAARDSTLAGMVLLGAPGYVGARALENQRQADRNPEATLTDEELRSAIERSRQADARRSERDRHLRFLMAYDPLRTAREIADIPVLILQGETDRQVTPEQADTLAAAFRAGGNVDVTVRRFAATNHLFLSDSVGWSGGYAMLPSKKVRPEVLGAIADWLTARLR